MNRAVKCPEAGQDAILVFDINDLLKLEEAFGEDYVAVIFADLDRLRITTIQNVVAIGLKAGDPDALLRQIAMSEAATRVADALYLTLHGRKLSDKEDG